MLRQGPLAGVPVRCGCEHFALSPLSSSFPTVGRQPPFSRRNPGQQRGTGWPPDKGATSGSPSSQRLGEAGDKAGSWEEEGHKPKTCPGQDVPLSSVESPNLKPVPVVCASQSLPSPQGPPGVRDPLQLDPGRETVLT